jgi:signal transduction histidine kinase
MLEHLGLTAAIEWETGEFQKRTGIMCDLFFNPKDIIIDKDLSITLYRIIQEALTNVLRHAHATAVTVSLKKESGKIELEVTDNGRGITEEQILDPKAFGLIGIRERLTLWHGKATFKGVPEKGTIVAACIPLQEKEVV